MRHQLPVWQAMASGDIKRADAVLAPPGRVKILSAINFHGASKR
jgi:hypothetical protein